MKLNFFKTVGVCATALTIGINCYAVQMPDVEYKYKDSKVIVRGEAAENDKFITLQILKAGKEFGGHTGADVWFYDQTKPVDGKYSFEVEYDCDTDEYAMRVASNGSKETKDIDIVKYDDFENAYKTLNSALDTDNFGLFKDTINNNRVELNFGFSLTDEVETLDAELKDYYAYANAKQGGLLLDDENKNTAIFRTYMTVYYLNRNEVENIDGVIDELYYENTELLEDYNYIAENDVRQKYLTRKMSSKGIVNLDDFKTALIKAVILTQTRYADGPGDVKDVIKKYGSVIGIKYSASDDVYIGLAGIDFENCDKLVDKFEDLVKNSGTGGGGSGGGSGGGGSKGNSFDDKYIFENIEKEESGKNQSIRMSFDDLEGVAWASEAILALADKGIVNGKGDGMFAPDDNVTREEFAKILVGAMGLDKGQTVLNGFVDVKENEWYARSVNIAKNAGIVNGIGGGKFGTGMSITREDMVVMIYNALKSRGVSMPVADLRFDDASMISGYAVNAVGALYKMGAVNGVSETEFAPKGIASRAQAAKIIYGVLEYLQ